ncbi:MAG: hypothetical protein ACRD88_00750 [Terriglobia bacterium]
MELVMWIVVGIVAGLGGIVLVPVLVVGTWFVVMTVILGLADGTLWLLDQGWKKNRGGRRNGKLPLFVEYLPSSICLGEDVEAESGAGGPRMTLKKAA